MFVLVLFCVPFWSHEEADGRESARLLLKKRCDGVLLLSLVGHRMQAPKMTTMCTKGKNISFLKGQSCTLSPFPVSMDNPFHCAGEQSRKHVVYPHEPTYVRKARRFYGTCCPQS